MKFTKNKPCFVVLGLAVCAYLGYRNHQRKQEEKSMKQEKRGRMQ